MRTAVVVGAGPGLGAAMARHLAGEGHRLALVARDGERLGRLAVELGAEGADATAFPADVLDAGTWPATMARIVEHLDGVVDVLYWGPARIHPDDLPTPITEATATHARNALAWIPPAADAVTAVVGGMIERRRGTILLSGGLSGVEPMPPLGAIGLQSAAVRAYALSLHAALRPEGVYAGFVAIGGVVEHGDVHRMIVGDPATYGDVTGFTLDPAAVATEVWAMAVAGDRAEAVFRAGAT